jgi:hypothetical protein
LSRNQERGQQVGCNLLGDRYPKLNLNSAASDLKAFLQQFLEPKTGNLKKDRNHLLAYVALPELRHPSSALNNVPDVLEIQIQSCVAYFKAFGTHLCYVQDLKPYIARMELKEEWS